MSLFVNLNGNPNHIIAQEAQKAKDEGKGDKTQEKTTGCFKAFLSKLINGITFIPRSIDKIHLKAENTLRYVFGRLIKGEGSKLFENDQGFLQRVKPTVTEKQKESVKLIMEKFGISEDKALIYLRNAKFGVFN